MKGVFIVDGNKTLKKIGKSGKKIAVFLFSLMVIGLATVLGGNLLTDAEEVEFKVLGETEIPQEIAGEVIPEYRDLERALACMVDGKVYVVVSRGEKPTSGFDVGIHKMILEDKDGVKCLAVYADFTDPEPGVALTQILTYPLKVVETNLTNLPEQIELRVQYQ